MTSDPLSQALDRLYAGGLDDFLPRRKQLVAELRASGNDVSAQRLSAAAKPTRTAWALDQIARRQPELLQALLRAREAAAAPSPGDADRLRRATRDYREHVGTVVEAARDLLAAGGVELNAIQARRMAETLQAVCAEDGEARAQLMAGTLTHDVDVEDPFAGLLVGEGDAASASPGRPAGAAARTSDDLRKRKDKEERERRDREQRERVIEVARSRVAELEHALRDTRTRARAAETAAAQAAREADRARAAASEAAARLEAARADLERAGRPSTLRGSGKSE
jgi:ribosomal protein L12E/L44/L45/RPP1/RPP2